MGKSSHCNFLYIKGYHKFNKFNIIFYEQKIMGSVFIHKKKIKFV